MPKFKVEVSELTMITVSLEARDAEEAEALVAAYYVSRETFKNDLDSAGAVFLLSPAEYTIHDVTTEVSR